jgi:hypothetical protein
MKDKNAVILSSYAIATNQIADQAKWHDNMMIWETARPYLYARMTIELSLVALMNRPVNWRKGILFFEQKR